jgi:hypothetical protein
VPLVENWVLKREYAVTAACCCCFRNSGNAIKGIFCVFILPSASERNAVRMLQSDHELF